MIELESRELSESTLRALAGYQAEIDAQPSYAERVAEAKRIWPSRKQNVPFVEVKAKLTEMCSGARRCCYCEDSMADEIEHIWPKDFYPDKTFVWENYLYACGPCNGPKGNQFALFEDETITLTVLEHPPDEPSNEPPPGESVLINPSSLSENRLLEQRWPKNGRSKSDEGIKGINWGFKKAIQCVSSLPLTGKRST